MATTLIDNMFLAFIRVKRQMPPVVVVRATGVSGCID